MPKRGQGVWAPSVPFTHKAFRPYVMVLGQLALAWNDLHLTLAMLFCHAMGGGIVKQFLAVWNAIKSDRAQRAMLVAALKAKNDSHHIHSKMSVDVTWICQRADALEDLRNDAIHSPLWGVPIAKGASVQPVAGLGNIRATKLQNKNLLAEFRWCRDSATQLRNFAMKIDAALSGRGSWPEKPKLPVRPATNVKQPHPQERKAKHPRRPQPSQP
jgi:hypothetical protein